MAGSSVVVSLVVVLFWLLNRPVPGKSKPENSDQGVVAPTPSFPKVTDVKALLQGTWYYLGPFDNPEWMKGFDTVYPPENGIDLQATYRGKNKQPIRWQEYPDFLVGHPLNFLRLFAEPEQKTWACIYLYHEIDVPEATLLPLSLGSDDTLTI